uniref:Uncharacterized protein n=1 Tax=Nelumbo nucifera TaxID=4432 RepID=A0A822YEH0_NELNU|nr:TPA_asm: hypothetical protein HUJ06_031117 [Nelumbo nucifera]
MVASGFSARALLCSSRLRNVHSLEEVKFVIQWVGHAKYLINDFEYQSM